MKGIGNILWLILGGLVVALIYFLVGVVLFCTIIGIPFGIKPGEPGCVSIVMNLLWILLGWWEVALVHLICGLVFCITIVGIPFGLQHFRMALMSVFPFGKEIRPVSE